MAPNISARSQRSVSVLPLTRRLPPPTPIAAAIAALVLAGAVQPAVAQTSGGASWFAAGATASNARPAQRASVPGAMMPSTVRQQAQSRERLQRSVDNWTAATRAIAAHQMTVQPQGRAAAMNEAWVRDGVGADGLLRKEGGQWDAAAIEASGPGADGRQTVTIKQNRPRAILEWESFHVGRNTDLNFVQQPTDAVLNKVTGADTRPSQIQGSIRGDGTVMVVNQNGVVFTGSSQIQVRNLVAAAANYAVSDEEFRKAGDVALYNGNSPTFRDALGKVSVHSGAQISTTTLSGLSSTEGGGYVLLAGKTVENAGTLHTPRGQAVLAAGDSFIIKKGQGNPENRASTTRGNEVTASGTGSVLNTGLIQAPQGDISLTGNIVEQAGVLAATTSVNQRGTIHLTATGAGGQVKLSQAGVSAILVDGGDATALDSQRSALQAPAIDGTDNTFVPGDAFRRDQSLVRVDSSGTVNFENGSLTLATGGQVAVHAAQRTLVRDGAIVDVSGAVGVQVAMAANNLQINIQGNEQRDSPVNRESGKLNSNDVWIDVRELVFVKADYDADTNPQGYKTDRWYTKGGLLEVGGYLGTQAHGAGQWLAQGGTVSFTGRDVVTQAGSQINLSGGTLDVQDGYIRQSWLRGDDGRLYEISRAPGDVLYSAGVYRGYEVSSQRWGHTRRFYDPLIAPTGRYEQGYTVGRAAGALIVGTKSAVLEGDIVSDTYQGPRQTSASQPGMDGYAQRHFSVALGGQLVVGSYVPYYVKDILKGGGTLEYVLGASADTVKDVVLGTAAERVAAGLDLDSVWPDDRQGKLYLDTALLNGFRLGAVKVGASGKITVEDALAVGHGGEINLYGPQVEVNAGLTAHGGTIQLGNVLHQIRNAGREDTVLPAPAGTAASVSVAEGVRIDASGLWSNLLQDPANTAYLPYQNGGSVSLRSTGDVSLGKNSLIDVSSGAAFLVSKELSGGKGGSISLHAAVEGGFGRLALDGDLKGYGAKGGGMLSLRSGGSVVIGGELLPDGVLPAGEAVPITMMLSAPVTLRPGDLLPFARSYTQVVANQILSAPVTFTNTGHTLDIVVGPGGWDLLGTNMDVYVGGSNASANRYRGNTGTRTFIPAGTRVTRINAGTLPAGYVIPESWTAPVPVQAYTVGAGNPAPAETVIEAGTALLPGMKFSQNATVRAPVAISEETFRTGFSQYEVVGSHGVLVPDGANIRVEMPAYRLQAESGFNAPTGTVSPVALELWTPSLYLADAKAATLTKREGASLFLQAGSSRSLGSDMETTQALVGRGATVEVDPGQSIEIRSIGQLTIDGRLNAWGGRIELGSVVLPQDSGASQQDAAGHGRSIWIGEQAVLDVAGRAVVSDEHGELFRDRQGRRYGRVDAGGEIVIGGRFNPETGQAGTYNELTSSYSADNLFVVVRPGALLDASGASAALDVPGPGAIEVASAGGHISLSSSNGLYLDGTFRSFAGGASAAGGALTVVLDTPFYRAVDAGSRVKQKRELLISNNVLDVGRVGAGLDARQAADALAYGHGSLAATQVEAGGFGTLTLVSDGLLSFVGDTSLSLSQALNVHARVMGLAEGAPDTTRVNLAAPYLRLAGLGGPSGVTNFVKPTVLEGAASVSTQAPAGSLVMQAGRLLELRDGMNVGGRGGTTGLQGLPTEVDRRGFAAVEWTSAGDLRFLPSGRTAAFYTPGDLTMAAAQIYPATGATAAVYAGWRGPSVAFDPQRKLTVARTTTATPETPYSVFGSLTLGAATIDQGGVLRAPLGALTLGLSTEETRVVNLLPGSLISVSAKGLVIPYGGTVDDIIWKVANNQISLDGLGTLSAGSITLATRFADIGEGAVIDLSGGGALTGAGFASGRGGSTDARYQPLIQVSRDGFSLPSLATNPIYAILPGAQVQQAPAGGERGASDPLLGQQITLRSNDIPGLPAGTYTLLPSNYALLPGAYRVELNGQGAPSALGSTTRLRNGSYAASGTLSVAGTAVRDSMTRQLVLTPANVLRKYSQYNETSYAEFVRRDAASLGVPRALIEADAKILQFNFTKRDQDKLSLNFNGLVEGHPAEGGYGSTVLVLGSGGGSDRIEILGDTSIPDAGYSVAIRASDLNRMEVNRLALGGLPRVDYGQNGNLVQFDEPIRLVAITPVYGLAMRSGAHLRAPEVLLVTRGNSRGGGDGTIEIEQGASISTLGQGAAAYDSNAGLVYRPGGTSIVAVSNGRLQWLAPTGGGTNFPGAVRIGTCSSGICDGVTQLYSEGSIAFVTDNDFQLEDAVRYGTRHLSLAVGAFNIGSPEALAGAVLAPGLTLNESVMRNLLRGDIQVGAPALETLELIAERSVNFFGNVTLSTLDASGKSLLDNLMLTSPAIYGRGVAGDVAAIRTGHLIWNGTSNAPGTVATGGAGEGSGTLLVDARRITFGYGLYGQPDGATELNRLALGFSNVELRARDQISANHIGTLSVYQSDGGHAMGAGRYAGGNLTLATPLLTGAAGSVNRITVGGAISVQPYETVIGNPKTGAALGAELALTAGKGLTVNTAVAMPSGKLTLKAKDDITLGSGAYLDMSGRSVTFFDDVDATQYSWGGDLKLESTAGNVYQAAGSIIDLSAMHNQGGRLTAIALADGAGTVDLQGAIRGGVTGHYEAGGTYVPYLAGGIEIQAQNLGDELNGAFLALNQRLNAGEVFGVRSFHLKQGHLTIVNDPTSGGAAGASLKANQIDVSLDGGHLTVAGKVDASGERVGSIRLAGKQGLTVASGATLDAHGTMLRLDSYRQIIEAPNRAVVELNSGEGVLTLASNSHIDLRYGTADSRVQANPALHDGRPLGMLELNAPRVDASGGVNTPDAARHGDVAIEARGDITVLGARSIAVNAVQRYSDAPDADPADEAASGKPYQVITQAYLDQKHLESRDFITAALTNADLTAGKLAGLNNARYQDAFHLRPGVQVVSRATDGDLVVSGDLDLSGHRYDSLNPNTVRTGVYGSGESGALVIRAGGDLSIYGSVNDGFAPPPETPDDNGWVLTPGVQGYGGDVVVPGAGITLAAGTAFPVGKTLNYPVTVAALTLPAGTVLPGVATLTAELVLRAGTVVGADIRDGNDQLLHAAGSVLTRDVPLPPTTKLGAGMLLPQASQVDQMTWPAGVPLPARVVLALPVDLKVGSLIPSMTDVKLPGNALSVPLRPVNGGRMGRNWAVAKMLPEGSLSWSLRLVAGADTEAVDPRMTRAHAQGRMVLADTHYSLFEQRQITIQPGTPPREEGVYRWNESGADFGVPGTIVDDPGFIEFCVATGMCDFEGVIIPGTPDREVVGNVTRVIPAAQNFSVIRTGTGALDLIAAQDVAMHSMYGVYTAGTSTASRAGDQAAGFNRARGKLEDGTHLNTGAPAVIPENTPAPGPVYESLVDGGTNSVYAAWYPDGGGDMLLRAGGSLRGDLIGDWIAPNLRAQRSSVNNGNWLWRQASGNTSGVTPIDTSWWINFGTYVSGSSAISSSFSLDARHRAAIGAKPELVGFTGFGTLGGGNLSVDVRGQAGMISRRGGASDNMARSEGLILAVGSTGRLLADGSLLQTGGGDLTMRLGGGLNPGLAARANRATSTTADLPLNYRSQNPNLNGALVNLRGTLQLQAGAIGGVVAGYETFFDPRDVRARDPYMSTYGVATGGPALTLGDASALIDTRGDSVLVGSGDATRSQIPYSLPYRYAGNDYGSGGYGWFSLWTGNTAINLVSAGGDIAPAAQIQMQGATVSDFLARGGRLEYPSQLSVAALSGSILPQYASTVSLLLAPSGNASLSLLAADSIYGRGLAIGVSGAATSAIPTPLNPAFVGSQFAFAEFKANNLSPDAVYSSAFAQGKMPLFTFGGNNAAAGQSSVFSPARIYARDGDIIGLETGGILSFESGSRQGQVWYEGAGPVWMRAGRDIVRSGTLIGEAEQLPSDMLLTPAGTGGGTRTGNLFVHNAISDVSIVDAGRDILYSAFNVAGPGTLEVSAGRNILMTGPVGTTSGGLPIYGEATIKSLGAIVPGDSRPGASIVVQAGVGPQGSGLRYRNLLDRYLNREGIAGTSHRGLANPAAPLSDQPGTVPRTYDALSLEDWLRSEYGYRGEAIDGTADAYLSGLQSRYSAANPNSKTILREVYEKEAASDAYLVNWLTRRYGVGTGGWRFRDPATGGTAVSAEVFDAATMDSVTWFNRLPAEQQRVFARQVYFSELRAAGREYNNPLGTRANNYLRGRNAIAALLYAPVLGTNGELLPVWDSQGQYVVNAAGLPNYQPYAYQGNLVMYRNAGIHTDIGGDIQVLTPGGAQTYGVEGEAPAGTAGLITRQGGHIQMYALGSILLGQSRIMTTFGGDILAWSSQGDINAGRGSKTTLVYTLPRREYDSVGNVSLSPDVPSTGAGIATLAPLAEVPPGDLDLIAPLGTIDAGEAGIRFSGNANFAALQVVNAANISGQGDVTGVPIVAAVNVGALTNASAAAATAAESAQETVARSRAEAQRNLPSIISVQILGFGEEGAQPPSSQPGASGGGQAPRQPVSYNPNSTMQLVGNGALDGAGRAQLTDRERANAL